VAAVTGPGRAIPEYEAVRSALLFIDADPNRKVPASRASRSHIRQAGGKSGNSGDFAGEWRLPSGGGSPKVSPSGD
jgi:hypothetical protein